MVKAFKTDAEALKALKRWAKDRPGAIFTIEYGKRWTSIRLHGLDEFVSRTLRGAVRGALQNFEQKEGRRSEIVGARS